MTNLHYKNEWHFLLQVLIEVNKNGLAFFQIEEDEFTSLHDFSGLVKDKHGRIYLLEDNEMLMVITDLLVKYKLNYCYNFQKKRVEIYTDSTKPNWMIDVCPI